MSSVMRVGLFLAMIQVAIIICLHDVSPWTIMVRSVVEVPRSCGEIKPNSTDIAVNRQSRQASPAEMLYTNDGHEHLAASRLDSAKLAPLTQWVQEQIFKHQHPIRCEKVLVSKGWVAGFGSELHVIGTHLAHAIENGYVLVWGSRACENLNDGPCHSATGSSRCVCFFKELSNCTANNNSQYINGTRYRDMVPSRFRSALKEKVPGMTGAQILFWWRAQSAGYLARLNSRTVSDVRNLRTKIGLHIFSSQDARKFPLPSGTVNAHIRGGDKLKEMNLTGPEEYVKAALNMVELNPLAFHPRALFVSGDDLASVLAACNGIQKHAWTCIYSNITRMPGGFHLRILRHEREKMRDFTLDVILQLLMSLEAENWIGTSGSNWNRLIDELRCVWVDKCGGAYVEVGTKKGYNW